MHSRGKLDGWSEIVDDGEEGFGEEAKTDPQMGALPAQALAPPKSTKAPKLRLPLPGELEQKGSQKALPVAMPPPRVDLELGLGEEVADKLGPRAPEPRKKSQATNLAEYKDVIRAGLVCVALLMGAIIYKLLSTPPVPAPLKEGAIVQSAVASEKPAEKPVQKAQPQPPVQAQGENKAIEAQVAPKTATPMVTIVSKPPGAMVEIDGILYGKTPIIMPSPVVTSALRVKLQLNGYKKWEELLKPNDAGHYNVTVTMQPAR